MTPNVARRTAADASLVLDVRAELGEGPVWDPANACVYFVDILRGLVHRFDPSTRASRVYDVGRPVGSLALTERGDLILAVQSGFARLDIVSGQTTRIADVDPNRPDLRMNDGKCDAAGRFWAGTMAFDERHGAGALYRLDPDGTVHTMLRDLTISNGIDWSDDGGAMYFVDSPTQSIDLFDFDATNGMVENRRTFVRIPSSEGAPDGLTLDAEGHVWVALWGGGAVHRYAPDGTRDAVIPLPARYPTSCAFGGSDFSDLFITTASIKLSRRERIEQPDAGGLFRARPGPKGRAPHRFRG